MIKPQSARATLRPIVDERLWGLTSVVRHATPGCHRGKHGHDVLYVGGEFRRLT
jgi:hypothetical protein